MIRWQNFFISTDFKERKNKKQESLHCPSANPTQWLSTQVCPHHGYTKHTKVGINRPKMVETPMEETRDSDVMFTWNEKKGGQGRGGNVGLSWCLLYTNAFLTDKQFHQFQMLFHQRGVQCHCDCQDTDSKLKEPYMSFLVCRVSLSSLAIIYLSSISFCLPSNLLSLKPSSLTSPLSLHRTEKSDLVSVYLVYLKRISGTQRKALSQEITTDSWVVERQTKRNCCFQFL